MGGNTVHRTLVFTFISSLLLYYLDLFFVLVLCLLFPALFCGRAARGASRVCVTGGYIDALAQDICGMGLTGYRSLWGKVSALLHWLGFLGIY